MGRTFKRGLESVGLARGLAVLASSLRIRSVCSSQVELSLRFIEIPLNLIYSQICNKPLKNTKEVKQGLVKIGWEETHEKNA